MLDYFVPSVREVLGPFLQSAGFEELTATETRVVLIRDGIGVSFAYYLEDLPRPWVAVEIGIVDQGESRLFGLWRVLPEDTPAADYPSWRFYDKVSLESVLLRDLDELLIPYASKLWADVEQIERTLSAQEDETEHRFLTDQRNADLRRARLAYEDERFQDSIDAYAQVAPTALSASDRRRQYTARSRLSP